MSVAQIVSMSGKRRLAFQQFTQNQDRIRREKVVMGDFVESTKEASLGGFKGIKKVRGLLVELKKVPPRFTESDYGAPKEQIQFDLEDAAILEMFPGEEEFELKDNKFTGWVTYAEEGKKPSSSSGYMKCWVASAEKIGKKPSEFIGQYVTLDKVPTPLFKLPVLDPETKKVKLGEDGKKVYQEIIANSPDDGFRIQCWSLAPDESGDSGDVRNYIRDLITGLNDKAALRKLIIDTRAKQFPEMKDMLNAGTLAEYLGLEIREGKFVKPEELETVSSLQET